MSLPTFQELYDEGKAQITGAVEHVATDFSAGSMLDAFTGVGAALGRAVIRRIGRHVQSMFVATATGDDLTYLVRDRYGLERKPGETDDELKARVSAYLKSLARGTVPALRYWILNYDGRASALTVREDFSSGATTLTITAKPGVVPADLQVELRADLIAWRNPSSIVNVNVIGA